MSDSQQPPVFGRRKDPVEVPSAPQEKAQGKPFASAGHKLVSLLRTPWEKRDGRWNHEFVNIVSDASFKEVFPELISPDGHRVYAVAVAEAGQPQAMKFANMVKKATKSGQGIAIFTDMENMEPAFVFKHGQLTPVITNGALLPLSTRPGGESGESTNREGVYLSSNPSPAVLPETTRAALREWLLRHYALENVRIQLRIEVSDPDNVSKTLGVLIDNRMPPSELPREIMLGIYWYLPPDIAAGYFSQARWDEYFPL